LTREDQSPHIFTPKTRLRPAEFLITCAKRLLQQYRGQSRHAVHCADWSKMGQSRRFASADRMYVLTPRATEIAICVVCCHCFEAGHRIRVQVTSSNFPAIDRNPNTGATLGMEGPFEWVRASQTVLHDAAHLSCINLPVVSG
jgi:X-Pro dipeptidyl-peptidase C-terminal non-catalytic domain